MDKFSCLTVFGTKHQIINVVIPTNHLAIFIFDLTQINIQTLKLKNLTDDVGCPTNLIEQPVVIIHSHVSPLSLLLYHLYYTVLPMYCKRLLT